MSSSIRPPGVPAPGPSELGPVSAEQPAAVEGSRASERLAEAGAVQRAESPTSLWLSRLSAGEISKQQAIDGLVEQALAAPGCSGLNAAQRGELSEVLRASLLDDPVLGRLLGE